MTENTAFPAVTEVLIVGAGPVGLTLAAALVAKSVDVVLIDKATEGANASRAAVVHARTLEVLRELDVSGELVRRGVIVPRFTVRDRDRVLLTIDFDHLPTPFPYTLMIPQNITEEVLHRLHILGGRVHRPYQLGRIEQDAEAVTATRTTGETIRASYAVGADGMHSTVREHTGIGFTGDTYAQSFILADVQLAPLRHRGHALLLARGTGRCRAAAGGTAPHRRHHGRGARAPQPCRRTGAA